jgi:hypothetical protein
MTDPAAQARGERVVYALRQAALLAVALLVAGLVTQRLRPPEALDRGFVSTPFLWAIVLWLVVLLINAVAFHESEMRTLERVPLLAALAIGAVVFISGLIGFGDGAVSRRVIYLFANSVGAIMFWWALISVGVLVVRRLSMDKTERLQPTR